MKLVNALDTVHLTSDQHFGHSAIIRYCHRPFQDVGQMDAVLTDEWNDYVEPDHHVYCLGDVTLGADASQYLRQLNGHIHIIPGGHDKRWLRKEGYYVFTLQQNVEVLPPLHTLEFQWDGPYPLVLVLCHYAMRTWDRSHYPSSLHVYGHSHGMLPVQEKSLDVGVDNAKKLLGSYRPFSLREALHFIHEQDNQLKLEREKDVRKYRI